MPDLLAKTYLRTRVSEQRVTRLEKSTWNRTRRPITGGGGGAATPLEFETVLDGTDSATPTPNFLVNVMPGTIIWHDKIFIVPPVSGQSYAAQFTVAPTAGDFHIWIQLDDTVAPTGATIQGNATIWSGSPNQPVPDGRRYWDISTVTLSGSPLAASLTLIWRGNITWTSIFGFWL